MNINTPSSSTNYGVSTSSRRPRFAGYRLEDVKDEKGNTQSQPQARLYLPGHKLGSAVTEPPHAEVIAAPGQPSKKIAMDWNEKHDIWEAKSTVAPGAQYRFIVDGQPRLDLLETVEPKKPARKDSGLGENDIHVEEAAEPENYLFNRVSTNAGKMPERSTVIADVYLDSVVQAHRLDELKRQNGGLLPVPDHFQRFAPNKGREGLEELLPHLREGGFTGILFKPFIGGDNLTSHRYWTVDPYRLNDSFKDKAEFRDVMAMFLKHGMKLYADGAFVNQGLNGIQMMSNLQHGKRSPYWNWFRHSESERPTAEQMKTEGYGRWLYPRQASEDIRQTFGILPVKTDEKTGHRSLNLQRFDIGIENDPTKPGFHEDRPTYIKLFDPTTTASASHEPRIPQREKGVPYSGMSAYPFRFPVAADEVRQKYQQAKSLSGPERKKLFMEWDRFRLAIPRADDSGTKWDGQIDVALMNTANAEVRKNLEEAVGYWSRFGINSQVNTVARALHPAIAALKDPDAKAVQQALDNITVRPGVKDDLKAGNNRVLPPIHLPQVESLSPSELDATIQRVRKISNAATTSINGQQSGMTLAHTLFKEMPLSVLPLPDSFKAILSMPTLLKTLRPKDSDSGGVWERVSSWLPGNNGSVQEHLGRRLQQAIEKLPNDERIKLAHPQIHSLLTDQLGESLMLHLMTGLEPAKLAQNQYSPNTIHEAFYKTVPSIVRNADPDSGVPRLQRFLNQRLQDKDVLKPDAIANLLKSTLQPLHPLSAAIAEQVLQKREYGMNWRIDAAKDVGDMGRIRSTSPKDGDHVSAERLKAFEEEMKQVETFWKQLGGAMRAPFPKSAMIAELTDLDKLSDSATEKKWMNKFFSKNTFSSTPNMNYLYSQSMQLMNFAQRPDEFGGDQMSPNAFLDKSVRPMSRALPRNAMQQMQNMISSHDYNTVTHSLLVNPALSTMDLLPWWGLRDDFRVATAELQGKACFADRLDDLDKKHAKRLGPDGTRGLLGKLYALLQAPNSSLRKNLSPVYRDYFNEHSKKDEMKRLGIDAHPGPTPRELKIGFPAELFNKLSVQQRRELGLHPNREQATPKEMALENDLKALLSERMAEHSEAKAMRGAIVNGILSMSSTVSGAENHEGVVSQNFWNHVGNVYNLDATAVESLQKKVEKSLYAGLDGAIKRWGRHFGYQEPDVALQHVFEKMDDRWAKGIPAFQDQPEKVKAFKTLLQSSVYAEMMKPVLPKLLRLFALQNALPGNPSVYLPDWLAQGGGEWKYNVFVQNRGILRSDKLAFKHGAEQQPFNHNADYQRFTRRAGEIFRTRSQGIEMDDPNHPGKKVTLGPSALNDGILLDIAADDENGVLPLVRDNGKEQVITLISTGQPQPLDWKQKAGAEGPGYAAVYTNPEPLRDYRTQLESPELTPGRIYRDVMNGERFKLDEEGALLSVENPDRGIDIHDCRILVRELKEDAKKLVKHAVH